MRVLITGGAGFVGANLARRLLSDCDVLVLDDFSTGAPKNLSGMDLKIVEGSVLDAPLVERLTSESDAIVHLAALPSVPRSILNPRATHDVNVNGTLNVLEAARLKGGTQVIFSSSSSVYGSNPALPKTESLAPRPLSPYAASKLSGEAYVSSYASSYGLPVLPFRFFNVYGPLQSPESPYAAVIPRFFRAARNGEPVTIYGDGSQTRDFTYVGTVAEVIAIAVLNVVTSTEPVNLAFGERTSVLQLLRLVEAEVRMPIARRFEPSRVGDVQHSQADSQKLKALFPGIARVSLRDGLRQTNEWNESSL